MEQSLGRRGLLVDALVGALEGVRLGLMERGGGRLDAPDGASLRLLVWRSLV